MLNPDKKTRVLLVDDNQTHRYSLSRHLAGSGFEVMQAHTGAEALALVAQATPDVVLLDIHLPDVLGFDICQTLKSDLTTKNIPVVFHSATLDTQLAKTIATDMGAVAFLSYPIDVDHLISVVRGAVARRDAANG